MKAIIWYLVFWGISEISFWRNPDMLEEVSPWTVLTYFLIWAIPFGLYLKKDLKEIT